MIVTREKFEEIIAFLASESREYGLDSETSGLRFEDRLFMLILYTGDVAYLFNFHEYPFEDSSRCLPREWLNAFHQIFKRADNTYYISNAKFDMGMLAKEGLFLEGRVVCTNAIGRIVRNNFLSYSLADSAERIGFKKNEDVEAYITKHKLYSWQNIPGKKKRFQLRRYWEVPMPVMVQYAEMDARLHYTVGTHIISTIPDQCTPVSENEIALTKVCFDMEYRGVQLDVEYTKKAQAFEEEKIRDACKDFRELTGEDYIDSNKILETIFARSGVEPARTDKGNPSFTDDALSKIGGPVADGIRTIRYHEKRVGSFYSSFLFYADKDGIIRPNMRQGGTETGRFSYSEPNLQQLTKEEDLNEEYSVRRCFVPRPGYRFLAIDYRQQEYRIMLDYAGEHGLIRQVLDGADVHQATADLCGISRREAKTTNFAILYGAGAAKLAAGLGITESAAKELKRLYFSRLPKVKALIDKVITAGEQRKYIYNWAGRRSYIANTDWAYVLPNHLIQGSGADVMKFAMVKIHDALKTCKSKMVLSIHDELVFEIADGEDHVYGLVRDIMEGVYRPFNGMKLETDAKWSNISLSPRDLK